MSTARVQAFLDAHHTGLQVIETGADISTAAAAGVAMLVGPAQIAKTLALSAGSETLLLVTRGDSRLDNAKFRNHFGAKPRFLTSGAAEVFTGQPVGGVSPFGHPPHVQIYCDESLRDFEVVYPAGGSRTTAVQIGPAYLAEIVNATWVDVTRLPREDPHGSAH